MRTDLRRGAVAAFSAVFVLGCAASTRPTAEFDAVHTYVGERAGIQPRWDDVRPEHQPVEARTRALLAQPLTVDAAIELALLNNRRVRATYGALGIARAELVQAGLLANPVLSADLTLGVSTPATGVAIGLVQNFVRALQIPLRKRIAGEALEATTLAVASRLVDLSIDIKRAFYRVQGAEQMLDLDRHVVETKKLSADVAQRQRAAGNIPDLDLANELAAFEEARVKLAADEAEVATVREELTALMGLWGPDAIWTIGGRLPDPPDAPPADGLETLAVSQRFDLAAARHETEALHQGLGLTGLVGILSDAQVGIEGERDVDSGIWSMGPLVSLPIPIFDQGQAARANAVARLRQSEEQFAALAVEIRSQVRRARVRLVSAQARAEHYRRVVLPLRQRVVEQTQLEYNGMLVGVFQLLQAKQAEIDAGRAYVDTLKDYWLARADLEGAVGGALPESTAVAPASGAEGVPVMPVAESHSQHHHGGVP